MSDWNLAAAWIGFLLGMLSGAGVGLFFHDDHWLGGYGSFRRRLLRLGHVSFFGIGFLQLAFVATLDRAGYAGGQALPALLAAASGLLIAGAVLMPAVCFLAAARERARHLFFLPVGSLIAAVVCLLLEEVLS